jgi:hypothetical protein
LGLAGWKPFTLRRRPRMGSTLRGRCGFGFAGKGLWATLDALRAGPWAALA